MYLYYTIIYIIYYFLDRKPRPAARGHAVWQRNGGRHEHVEHVVARGRVHVHGRGDRHVGHGRPLGPDS